ncbi:DUF11 domain-containing protein [Spirosoma sp. BT702]|uniref:DUF11 domain-containing protein n=1 Tax=Spirosoma profusum TaxID=2771354 RepID=A0A926XYM1_9BACT|nr:sialate O-acetylesterase [Spirosoma profusum]MBD2700233.1 DUF11 domain-containing protein [Spirosoma profusum]
MKKYLRLLLLVYWLCPLSSIAQIVITSPVPRMVFQRNLANQGTILVAGTIPTGANGVEARVVPLASGQGEVTAWTPLQILPNSSAFRGNITAKAGFYRLDVRAKSGSSVTAGTSVNRIGVGEVFIVAGQSNNYGGFQRVQSSVEDRVSSIDIQLDSISDQLLPLRFSNISYGTAIGPSQPPHLWGMLGDKLVQRLNVPVMFLGASLGATSSSQWQQSAAGNIGTTPQTSVYRQLGTVLLHYVSRTGARAVLWHQGESDNFSDQPTYYNNIQYVIQKSRQQVHGNQLPWVVSRASYILGQTNPAVIAAQNQLIANVPSVYAGPSTDDILGPTYRPDDIHMKGPGLIEFTNRWDQSLSASFFQNAVPYLPNDASALITSGYTLPITRRPGEVITAASIRNVPQEPDNQFFVQIVRTSDGQTVYESAPTTSNPIMVTLPANLPEGQYQFRTVSTHPVIVGTLSEPFVASQSSPVSPLPPVLQQATGGGTADPVIRRFGYRYETESHGFYAMVQATAPVEVRIERIDGGGFSDSGWNVAPSISEAPDYVEFADFNYIRNYPPISGGVGGVEPTGRYRYSVRRQGDSGPGLWYDLRFLGRRNILYYPMEPTAPIPPVVTITDVPSSCVSGSFNVSFVVTDGAVNGGNMFTVRLSDANGSFANETTVGSGTGSPIAVTLPSSLPIGSNYRVRVLASNPELASAPSAAFALCSGADLSITMRLGNRTPAVEQPIDVTITLTNSGPLAAENVAIQSLLPNGLEFINTSSPAVNGAGNTVNISAGSIAPVMSIPYMFQVKTTQPGTFFATSQITSSNQIDPDSQPNSGTGDGQDDAATVDLRTLTGFDTYYAYSPNPNQTPLPPVQTNPPPTNPSKSDLSLSIIASKLLVLASEPIQLQLSVSNRGGVTANSVSVQTQLPAGWQLLNPAGFTVNGQTITGTIGSIPVGQKGTLTLSVQPSSGGIVMAQIAGSNPADDDSTPGNGYQNGEDDEAAITILMK